MTRSVMSLIVSTPLEIVVDAPDVVSFRAADSSGDFGILPGHVDLLSVLEASVIRWKEVGRKWHYCALRGGVLTVEQGRKIRIACRKAIIGTDLVRLENEVKLQQLAETESARTARVAQTKLHAEAIRQIMRHMARGPGAPEDAALESLFQ